MANGKLAYVNGEPISREAVQFEFDRLVKFYSTHGMGADDLKKNVDKLLSRAQEQAIGAKLLLARAAELDLRVSEEAVQKQLDQVVAQVGGRDNFVKALAAQKMSEDDFRKELAKGCRVDALVEQACSSVPDPAEEEIEAYFAANAGKFKDANGAAATLVDVHDAIRDLLRHERRGVALEAFVEELREKATIEYK